jgi:hypothetical protein
MAREDLIPIEYPEDPQRCQAHTGARQCTFKRIEGADFCGAHKGSAHKHFQEKASLSNYRLTVYQGRLLDKKGSSEIKSLRDEIGILRILMEERLNQCKTDVDLMINAGVIGDLTMKIEKLVTSCHKLEGSMGELLDKQALIQFANEMISIIGEEVKDPEVVDKIASKLLGRMETYEGV